MKIGCHLIKIPRYAFLISTTVLCLCPAVSCTSIDETDRVIIAGSTSVQPYVEILAEDYVMSHSGHIIDVQGGGSSAGIQAVGSGTALIGMSSRGLTDTEAHLWSIEIAMDGLAIIINPENPVKNLTMEQLRSIYAAEYTNWNQIGGPDASIHLTTREEGSGTRSAFEDMVMDGKRITAKAIVQDSNGAVRQFISDDPYSIGYISLGLVDAGEKRVKTVQIDGVEPTRENVQKGEYMLFRSFLFIASEEPYGRAMEFIAYILSAEGQQILENEGLIPGSGTNMLIE